MNLRQNSVANILGTAIRFLTAFATQVLLIRMLGLERYGLWVVLMSMVGLIGLADLGLASTLTIYLAAARSRNDSRGVSLVLGITWMTLTVLGVLVSVIWLLCSNYLLGWLFQQRENQAEILLTLQIFGLGLVPRLWQQWMVGWENGLSRYDLQAKAESAHTVVLNAGMVALVWLGADFVALAWWNVALTVASLGYHVFLVFRVREAVARPRWETGLVMEILRFAVLQWLTNIAALLFSRVDRLLVSALLGLNAVGLYAAAVSIVSKINELSALPIQPITPAISAAHEQRDVLSMRRLFERAFRLNAVVVYVLVVTIVWGASVIATAMTPQQAGDLEQLLLVMAFAYGAYSLVAAGYYTLLGVKVPGIIAVATLLGAVFTLGLMALAAPWFGLLGIGLANAGYVIIWTVNLYASRYVGFSFRELIALSLPVLVSIMFCAAARWLVMTFGDLLAMVVGGWVTCMFLCLWIDRQDVAEIWRVLEGKTRSLLGERVHSC